MLNASIASGWTWGNYRRDPDLRYRILKQYLRTHGVKNFRYWTVHRGIKIESWVNSIRTKYIKGKLPRDMIRRLEALDGWSWQPIEERHQKMADLFRKFVERHGWKKFTLKARYRGRHIGN